MKIHRLFPSAAKFLGLALLACACIAPATAAEVISPTFFWRYDAAAANLGVYQSNLANGNPQVGLYTAGPTEWRNIMAFKIDELGVPSSQIASATLKFTGFTWNEGSGNFLDVDQLTGAGNYFNQNQWNMYQSAASTVVSDANQLSQYDITAIFKTALDSASPTQGIAFRVFNSDTANVDYTAQTVSFNSWGTVGTPTLEYEVIPEPSTLALLLGGLGSLVLLRLRRALS